jgi:hypothetical protein
MAHMVTIKLTPTYFLLWHRSSNCSFAWKSGFNVLSLWDFSSTPQLRFIRLLICFWILLKKWHTHDHHIILNLIYASLAKECVAGFVKE